MIFKKKLSTLYGVFSIVLFQNYDKGNILYPKSIISACFY